jgi:hypothetical protein
MKLNEKVILPLKIHIQRFLFNIPLYLKGKPIVLKIWPLVFKIAFSSVSRQQLSKEVKAAGLALTEPFFSNLVVRQKQITQYPIIAVSRFIRDDGEISDRMSKMIMFSMNQFHFSDRFRKKSSGEVIKNHINAHVNERNSDLFIRYRKLVESSYFDFEVPYGFMHGDFHNENAIINNDRLYLVDWEYSCSEGSILYDWWYLWRSLNRYKERINSDIYMKYCAFLKENIERFNIDNDQFNAFGCAMHISINFSRIEKRGGEDRDIVRDMSEIYRIMNQFELSLNT